ncbi:hypothetical protein V6N12_065599 [Hibiscus sabdariffa]|uniref:Uncharacterized protein n=1 Tax=Hibiscus sabdariffa TaxID=183260 RepID=A0ABR2G9N5_9ROSI
MAKGKEVSSPTAESSYSVPTLMNQVSVVPNVPNATKGDRQRGELVTVPRNQEFVVHLGATVPHNLDSANKGNSGSRFSEKQNVVVSKHMVLHLLERRIMWCKSLSGPIHSGGAKGDNRSSVAAKVLYQKGLNSKKRDEKKAPALPTLLDWISSLQPKIASTPLPGGGNVTTSREQQAVEVNNIQ